MFCRAVSIALVLTGIFVLAPNALAQVAPLEGNVMGTDGRPLQSAEIRLEGKDKPSAPITTTTGSNGRYLFAGSSGPLGRTGKKIESHKRLAVIYLIT